MMYAAAGLIRHELIWVRRYWINYLSFATFYFLVFLLLFAGVRSITSSANLGNSTESLIVAYWVILLTGLAFEHFANLIANQATAGTLEQLYLSPFGFAWIGMGSVIGKFVTVLILNVPLLFLLMLVTERWLHLDLVSLLPLTVVILAQA